MNNMDLVKVIESENIRNQYPEVEVGDFVKAHLLIKEGAKERIQVFEGYVIARKGSGLSETITIRRVSYGIGVERILPVNSPKIDHIDVIRKGKIRRAKLRVRSEEQSFIISAIVRARLQRSHRRSDSGLQIEFLQAVSSEAACFVSLDTDPG